MYLIDKLKISIMEKLMTKQDYAKQVRQINSIDGYFNRFYELSGECRTHQEAWIRLEEERDSAMDSVMIGSSDSVDRYDKLINKFY
jgi:hypothetical protein